VNIDKLKALYEKNKLGQYDQAVQFLNEMNGFLNQTYLIDLDDVTEEELNQVVQYLVLTQQNTIEHFIMLMRYFKAKI
jgi:hypothetical protein